MRKLTAVLGLSLFIFSTTASAQVGEEEIQLLRQQVEQLTKRLDQLEKQNQQSAQSAEQSDRLLYFSLERYSMPEALPSTIRPSCNLTTRRA